MHYVPLHVHTDASLDGAGTVQSLVSQAKRLNMTHLAMTDHGTLGNAVAFWSACDEQNIAPILGMEAYLSYRAKRYHITLLSLNEQGFNNLVYLDTESHVNNYVGGYPLVTLEMLDKFKAGVVALSGCASSALYEGELSDALAYVGDVQSVLTKGNFLMEVQFLGKLNTWQRPLEIAQKLRLEYVVTNDTHYPCQHQFPAHQAVVEARRGYTYDSQHLWLKSADEIIREAAKHVDKEVVVHGLNNTLDFAAAVEPWSMKAPPSLPYIENVDETLQDALKDALKRDVAGKSDRETRISRLKFEYRILKEKGFLDYIYILWDIVSHAKRQGIRVGPGRGSGGGSYVLYLLGITSIDPISHNLLFERFINPGRSDYPDVDVDFESDRRGEVMEYASNRWRTIPIATYNCYSHKSAIHDIARTLTIPKDLEERAADADRESDAFEEFINDKPDALVVYETMLGQIRHRGKHAAGVIIANRPVPVERISNDQLAAAWAEGMNTKDLSKVGIVKYDILGLTALSQLKRMEEITGVTFPVEDYSDPAVYQLFCDGDVAGVFQWSGSDGIRELTMRVAPRNFYDLTTCNALYRPGALDAGTAEHYPEFMRSPRKLHPKLDKHLAMTYGVICYQEQVMAVVAEVTGGDLAQADIARRLISKAAVGDPKWEKQIEELHHYFLETGERNGYERSLLLKLWHEIYTHSGYSYNLCLSGSTQLERAASGRGTPTPFISIKELYDAWQSKTPWGKKLRSRGVKVMCLCEDGRIRPRQVKAVHYSGRQQTYRVTLENGMSVDATLNHRLLSDTGYRRVRELRLGDSLLVEDNSKTGSLPRETVRARGKSYQGNGFPVGENNPSFLDGRTSRNREIREAVALRANGHCEECGKSYDGSRFEFAHTVPGLDTTDNIRWLCNPCHKQFDTLKGERPPRWTHGKAHTSSRIVSIQALGIEDTYDVEMADEPHNFLANGIVSHNSHASAYTMISYQMAWYKVYHRPAFTTAVLQYDKANAQTYILDAIEHGLEVQMPDINYSDSEYALQRNTIYLPLSDIAFLGEGAVQKIVEERKANGPFMSYEDFGKRINKRTCNNRAKMMLERIGAFLTLSGDPASLIDRYDEIPVKNKYDTQLEILGYVVPSRALFAKIQNMAQKPAKKGYTRFAGFISKVTRKRSIHGEYSVFTLSPSGSFWMREPRSSLKVGVFVSGTKSKFGHSTDVKTYRLDSGE